MKNWDKILMEAYNEIYRNAEPPCNFEEELTKCPRVDGKIQFPFMDYSITEESLLSILEGFRKKYRMSKYQYEKFRITMLLGATPKTKRD